MPHENMLPGSIPTDDRHEEKVREGNVPKGEVMVQG